MVKDVQFLRDPSLRETTKRLMDLNLSVDGEGADWVTEPKGDIKKANLTFTTKILWLIVLNAFPPQLLIISLHGIEQCLWRR